MSYTDRFGASPVTASQQTYNPISTGTAFTFSWPTQYVGTGTYLAQWNDISTIGSGINLTLPPANQASVGESAIFNNIGGTSFFVLNNSGAAVATVGTTQAFVVNITNNTSAGGTWNAVQFGAGAASAQPGALQGPGLRASGNVLEWAVGYRKAGSAGQGTILASDLGTLVDWTGGSGTLNILSASTYGTNFTSFFRNSGSGAVITANGTMDGTIITFQQGDSCGLVFDGTQFHTVGRNGALAAGLAGNGLLNIGNQLQVKSGGWPVSVDGTGVHVTQTFGTTTNTDNNYALSVTNFDGTYVLGQVVSFTVNTDNTGTLPQTTLNVNGIAAGTVFKTTPAGPSVLGTGDWQGGAVQTLINVTGSLAGGTTVVNSWYQISDLPQTLTPIQSINVAGTVGTFFMSFGTSWGTAYNQYDILFNNLLTNGSNQILGVRVCSDPNGTTPYSNANGYRFVTMVNSSSGGAALTQASTSNGNANVAFVYYMDGVASHIASGKITITNPNLTGVSPSIRGEASSITGSFTGTSGQNSVDFRTTGQAPGQPSPYTGLQFVLLQPTNGTFLSGNFTAYGVKPY